MNDILRYAMAVLGVSGMCVAWLLVQRLSARWTGRDPNACASCEIRQNHPEKCL